jgi:hypothetical protein
VQASVAAYEQALAAGKADSFEFEPPLVKDLMLFLDDVADGGYNVRWFDPQTSKWSNQSAVSAQNGVLSIPMPPFNRDLAAKIVPTVSE